MAVQDLNDMMLFAKVVEHRGYSAAAHALGMHASKLSRRISALEDRVGVRLLQRSTRSVTVTEIGQSFYRHCLAIEAEALAARETIERTRSTPQGLIRLSCPLGLLNIQVAPIISRFLVANPLVQMHVEATTRRVDVIEEGFDVAIRVRVPPLEASELAVRPLAYSGLTLVASPALLDALERPFHPQDLARLPTLALPRAGDRHTWEFGGKGGTSVAVQLAPRLMTDDFGLLRQAAIDGVGIAYLPHFLVQNELGNGVLEHVLPDYRLPAGVIHAVFPSRRGMVPAVREFIDALVAGFKETGDDESAVTLP